MMDWMGYLCPHEWVSRVSEIDLDGLLCKGITGIIIDLDNTLVGWHCVDVPQDILEWVEGAKRKGFRLCIASNTHNSSRLERLASCLGIGFAPRAAKPRRGGLRAALKAMGIGPKAAVMVGDQIFTDILAGNRMGLYTILVKPLTSRDFAGTKINRVMEKLVLKRLRRQGRIQSPEK
ncbi:MAG: YqeG family HAD IIIA-type phosphatase [Armatimonadetes bacterium]|nr:YqeG family HAD IIIA-type phosphatase [Armatimonadota bacterium]